MRDFGSAAFPEAVNHSCALEAPSEARERLDLDTYQGISLVMVELSIVRPVGQPDALGSGKTAVSSKDAF